MFTFAHLSDPHLAIVARPGLGSLMSKRLLGYLSWRARRQAIHESGVLAALTAAIKQAKTDHVVITGDLTNISLPGEFDEARRWLEAFGPPDRVTVIPGNHDAYVGVPWARSLGLWTDYMRGDVGLLTSPSDFPSVRVRGPVAFIGVSSAHPSAPHLAVGSLGRPQIDVLEQHLGELGRSGKFRVVLIHHPPVAGTVSPRKSLLDAEPFAAALARSGAELVLHGHMHRFSQKELAGPAGAIPVIGVATASARSQKGHGEPAQYHLYRIDRGSAGWRLAVGIHALDETSLAFRPKAEFEIGVPIAPGHA
jgi:3',5'-cyclic AMP phosphodiesterase CpdA